MSRVLLTILIENNDEGRALVKLVQVVPSAMVLSRTRIRVEPSPECPRPRDLTGDGLIENNVICRALISTAQREGEMSAARSREVAEGLGYSPNTGTSYCALLTKKGLLFRVRRGLYTVAPSPECP